MEHARWLANRAPPTINTKTRKRLFSERLGSLFSLASKV